MLGDTMVETTFLLQWLVIAFAVLLVLLIMINLLLRMMRRWPDIMFHEPIST